jgi:molecular chaperone DnaK
VSVSSIIGIDLGTSNTVVAHIGDDGVATTLADEDGNVLIPSVVSMDEGGKVIVGYAAKERRLVDPKNVIFGAKRLVGRTWNDPELQHARKRLPYELRQGKNESVRVMIHDELYTLPEVSAFILRKAKAVAEHALGREVDRAVVTVPANFNDLQREATKLAGMLAGLEVMQVLNEPTAAALAYGYGKAATERIAVYDFGGGTFDVTLLTLVDDVFRVRATAGDMFLGGDDIDLAIANRIATAYVKRHYYDPRTQGQIFDPLREAAERLKFMLSTRDEAAIDLDAVVQGFGGKGVKFTFAMTRAELAEVIDPFIARTLAVCETAFVRAKVAPKQFDRVVLVGGSTRIPRVRERVADFFGRAPEDGVHPDEAVALGAAIQGIALEHVPRRLGGAFGGRAPMTASGLFDVSLLPEGDAELATAPAPPARLLETPSTRREQHGTYEIDMPTAAPPAVKAYPPRQEPMQQPMQGSAYIAQLQARAAATLAAESVRPPAPRASSRAALMAPWIALVLAMLAAIAASFAWWYRHGPP